VVVEAALTAFEGALADLRAAASDGEPAVKAAARFRARRLEHLADLSRSALHLLRILIDSARVDAGPIKAISDALTRRS